MNSERNVSIIVLLSMVLAMQTMLLRADQSVTLAWDPNPEPDVSNYIVYYGTRPRNYQFSTNVGNVTTATVYGLPEGVTHFFAITAKNTSGMESDFSKEVTNSIPAMIPQRPKAVVIRSGIESAPTPNGPWTEILATFMPFAWDTNLFYRTSVKITEPPIPK